MKSLDELKETTGLLIKQVSSDGGCGEIFKLGKSYGSVIWSYGGGWEHVSVCPYKRSYTPSWDDMCKLKDMFFRDEETVVQYHPAKSEYVNNMPNCLHLWRPLNAELPVPPSIFVGIKKGQTMSDILKAIEDDKGIEIITEEVKQAKLISDIRKALDKKNEKLKETIRMLSGGND